MLAPNHYKTLNSQSYEFFVGSDIFCRIIDYYYWFESKRPLLALLSEIIRSLNIIKVELANCNVSFDNNLHLIREFNYHIKKKISKIKLRYTERYKAKNYCDFYAHTFERHVWKNFRFNKGPFINYVTQEGEGRGSTKADFCVTEIIFNILITYWFRNFALQRGRGGGPKKSDFCVT